MASTYPWDPWDPWDLHGSLGSLSAQAGFSVGRRREEGTEDSTADPTGKEATREEQVEAKTLATKAAGQRKQRGPHEKARGTADASLVSLSDQFFGNVLPELNFGSRRDGDPTRKLNIVNSM